MELYQHKAGNPKSEKQEKVNNKTNTKEMTRGIRNQKPEIHDNTLGQGNTGTQGQDGVDKLTEKEGKMVIN